MKKQVVAIGVLASLLFPHPVFADVAAGDRIITLGNDLTSAQRQQIESDFSKTSSDKVITVTHADEEQALHGIVSDALIGTRAISSSLIVFQSPGYGIRVSTKNITWVSASMYSNALLTAGVKDADVTVEAPFPVSGTAALAGITKAFEVATGHQLDPTRKDVANQEVVQTAQLGQQIGNPDKAAAFVNELKTKLSQEHPQTDDQYRNLISEVANQMGIQLNDSQINSLVDLLKKINGLHINWDAVSKEALNVRDSLNQFIHNHPKQANAIVQFFHDIILAIAGLFKQLFG
ncbi:DUF1002 domain-containing protein [Alicyclobacillus pomorum]|jgi:uncharacterized protein YpuA (DUF1002 family)|uniref:DUF1002 domain-containing protein n=1 Tax=Alicyclobacillus pomorum TaxID=204470 RepID=UPI000413BCAB|nr:DUF1002 domain-containing protein [Alicyclobacillus pomorum]